MKALLHQIVLLKIEKQIQKLVQKNQYLKNETNLSNKYTEWKFTDFEQLSSIISSKTIKMGGVKSKTI
ncbi:MAG: hypothetical protein EAZ85_13990 [Bacteroidetes bacterium]|nr:MAG: hypothetical protein EAZ85_13990 [Bacteroidota bacterium]TAG84979.1 MAG: hypothetical protein EAZ20_16230 [Bacteroidota bacterium]